MEILSYLWKNFSVDFSMSISKSVDCMSFQRGSRRKKNYFFCIIKIVTKMITTYKSNRKFIIGEKEDSLECLVKPMFIGYDFA